MPAKAKPKRDYSSLSMQAAIREVQKKYGAEVVVDFTGDTYRAVDVVPSGAFLLDAALGVGGFPRGRITEIFGPESSGKSSICMSTARNAQQEGEAVLYLDYEHSFDPRYASVFGIDLDQSKFLLVQPDTLEQGMQITELLLKSNNVGLVICDSLAAMMTVQEMEGEIGDTHVASQARALAQVLKRLVAVIDNSNAAVLFINHIKEVIGGYNPTGRTRYTTPGGRALKFYASCRVELRVVAAIKGRVKDFITGKSDEGTSAVKVTATVIKNKLGPPYKQAYFFLQSGQGVSDARAVIEVAVERNYVRRNGSRYLMPFKNPATGADWNLGGMEAALEWADSHPDEFGRLARLMQKKVQESLALTKPTLTVIKTVEEDGSEVEELTAPDDPSTPGENGRAPTMSLGGPEAGEVNAEDLLNDLDSEEGSGESTEE